MKILVFSDIHGNLSNLKKLMECADFKTADRVIFLGDVVVGFSRPNECIDMLKNSNIECLIGNNDSYVCKVLPEDEKEAMSKGKIEQIAWMQSHVTEENKKLVNSWPKDMYIEHNGKTLYFTHYLWESDDNVVPSPFEKGIELSAKARADMFEGIKADYIFFGHEHIANNFSLNGKYYHCVATAGCNAQVYYVMLTLDDGIKIEEKSFEVSMKDEIALLENAGYPYNKARINEQKNATN